ncbi:MAG: adenosylcobinamide-phosphate synthase CbiB [Rubrobacter sp.]
MRGVRRVAVMSLALLMDATLGEPPERIHPVVWMGRAVGWLDERSPSGEGRHGPALQLLYGAGGVTLVGGVSYLLVSLVERRSGGIAGFLAEAWLLKSCFAYRALEGAAEDVISNLDAGEVDEARDRLRSLVSRDRAGMGEAGISAAVIESVAENLSDSFTAPLLAYALGGLPAAFAYRAVNTADAMIGYRGRHEYTGKFTARTDDVLNLIPARVTAACIVLAAKPNTGRAVRAMLRDHALTESPNAGWPMSAVAGALGVSLEKSGQYHLNPEARHSNVRDARLARDLIRRAAIPCALLPLVAAACRGGE